MTSTRIVFNTALYLFALGSAIILAPVTDAAASVFGPTVELSLNATTVLGPSQCNSNMGVRAYFIPGLRPQDIPGLLYKFCVKENNQSGLELKFLFGGMRLYTPGVLGTYLPKTDAISQLNLPVATLSTDTFDAMIVTQISSPLSLGSPMRV